MSTSARHWEIVRGIPTTVTVECSMLESMTPTVCRIALFSSIRVVRESRSNQGFKYPPKKNLQELDQVIVRATQS